MASSKCGHFPYLDGQTSPCVCKRVFMFILTHTLLKITVTRLNLTYPTDILVRRLIADLCKEYCRELVGVKGWSSVGAGKGNLYWTPVLVCKWFVEN